MIVFSQLGYLNLLSQLFTEVVKFCNILKRGFVLFSLIAYCSNGAPSLSAYHSFRLGSKTKCFVEQRLLRWGKHNALKLQNALPLLAVTGPIPC